MSLKAKLEAVIYAADEPVTLGQLASLFAADALEWKAEQEAAARAAQAEEAEEPQPMLEAVAESLGLDAEEAAEVVGETAEAAAQTTLEGTAPPAEAAPETGEPASEAGEAAVVATEAGAPEQAAAAADEESEARRLARQRDREVKAILRQVLDQIVADYAADGRGVEIREIAGGFRMATKPECHDAVRLFIKSQKPALKLSLPALETLAVIAYKQPVTAPEVSEIRGVESGGVLGSLLSRKLIATAGRKQVIGRPILYKTTKEFLLRFGLKDISELPSMEEFEKMASELTEPADEAATEEAAQAAVGGPPEGQPDLDENAPENGDAPEAEAAETAGAETRAADGETAEAADAPAEDVAEAEAETPEPEAESPELPEAEAPAETETGDTVATEPATEEASAEDEQAETETPNHGN